MLAANPPKCPFSSQSLNLSHKGPFFLTHSLPLSSSPSPSFKITCSAAEERSEIRLGLPSKGRMAADTLDLLKDCQLSVKHVNPRQDVAKIPELSNLEVWFQRPKDIVRKLLSGDLDLGIAGLDTVSEYGRGSEDLIIVHDALGYGECHLSLAAVLVASKRSLLKMKNALETTHEILERLEAKCLCRVDANMSGNSAQEVAERVLSQPSLAGLQGPTINTVYCKRDGQIKADYYATVIYVPKKTLYKSVQQLKAIGGSQVRCSPVTCICDEETPRWRELLSKLGL